MSADTIEYAADLIESGEPHSVKKGVNMVERLAECGHPTAAYAMATWYIHEVYGYPRDIDAARKCLEVAMEGNVPSAFHDAAVLEIEIGKKNRFRDAFGLLLVAAMLGDEESQLDVVEALKIGRGTLKNEKTSSLLEKAFSIINESALTKR